jgi:hypothetical protein
VREQAGLRTVVAIAIAVISGGSASTLAASEAYGQAAAVAFAGGFAAGAIQSGNLRGAVVGGISSLAFYGIGQKFSVRNVNIASGEGIAAYSKLALASGITGGVMAELQGGRFGNGFVTAGASAVLAPIPEAASSNSAAQTVVAAVISGTISEATGGKFANGAITGAFQFAMGLAVAENDVVAGQGPGGAGGGTPNAAADAFLVAESQNAGQLFCTSGCSSSPEAAHEAAGNRYLGASIAAKREAGWNVFKVSDGTYSFTYPSLGATLSEYVVLPKIGKQLNFDSRGHTHWNDNSQFSVQDWRVVTLGLQSGPGNTLFLAAKNGSLQFSVPSNARGIGVVGMGGRFLPPPGNYSDQVVTGVALKTTYP